MNREYGSEVEGPGYGNGRRQVRWVNIEEGQRYVCVRKALTFEKGPAGMGRTGDSAVVTFVGRVRRGTKRQSGLLARRERITLVS